MENPEATVEASKFEQVKYVLSNVLPMFLDIKISVYCHIAVVLLFDILRYSLVIPNRTY